MGKTERQIVAIYQQLDKEITGLLGEFYKKYNLPIMNGQTVDNVATMNFVRQRVVMSDAGKITRLNALQRQIRQTVNPLLLSKDKLIGQMAGVMYQGGIYQNLWAINRTTGIELGFNVLNERAVAKAVASPLSILSDKTFNETNTLKANRAWDIAKINREIEMGLGRGDSFATVSRRIDQVLGFRDASGKLLEGATTKRGLTYEAMRIVRTEMMRAMEAGKHDFFMDYRDQLIEEGVVPRLMWVATLDNRTRDVHANRDGELSNEDGEFEYSDGNWYIQHNSGIPEEDINCRCATVTSMEGMEPILRRSREDGVIPTTNFKEWADDKDITSSIYGEEYQFDK